MKSLVLSFLVVGCLTICTGCVTTRSGPHTADARVRAHQVVTVTDDFVVDVYHNGVRVPDPKRKLLLDRFGATVESMSLEVQRGDWLVFHVVNNRLRWDRAYFFGVAGVLAPGEFGFVSDLASGAWSVCDSPALADRFISDKRYLSDNRPASVERPWHEGKELMERYAGGAWPGEAIWGRERSTWVKIIVP
jgi:hypothetical protein